MNYNYNENDEKNELSADGEPRVEKTPEKPENSEFFNNEHTEPGVSPFQSAEANNYIDPVIKQDPYAAKEFGEVYTEPWKSPVYKSAENDEGNYFSPSFHVPGSHAHDAQSGEPKKKNRGRGFMKVVSLVLTCVILGSAAGVVGGYYATDYRLSKEGSTNQVVIGSAATGTTGVSNTSGTYTGDVLAGDEIYDMACKQVVGITTAITTTNIFGQSTSSAVSGSGFIISTDGYILTNNHVIEYAAQYGYDLTVMLHDGTTYKATIVGYEDDNDVAVIKIDAEGLSPVVIGNSSAMKVGEQVYTVGNPLGELAYTMTGGMVSALDRTIVADNSTSIDMFQIDAAVNSGNSGGPVYNSKGEVIGIVTAKYSDSGIEGLGFAIPINDAIEIATQLIENGYVAGKAYLGVSVKDIESYVTQYYNMPSGVYVDSVNTGSCAEKAGLKKGDIITGVGDVKVTSVEELKTALKNCAAGDTSAITVYRSGETLTLTVTFDEDQPTETTTQSSATTDNSSDSSGGTGGESSQFPGFGFGY
ncbi:MAG: PDZ domain-containing protein [Clostridia bacterium]|nr:PDZ domain-containing protein [Clostridia bacterium]